MIGKFIVIEGLDAAGKSTLVVRLAESLSAALLRCPPKLEAPEFIDGDLRSHFDNRPASQRRAYYRAANLIASEQTEVALQTGHVVMDRYWTSTVAFAALDDSNLDEEWYGCYPPELRKPDMVILLTVDEENRTKRMQGRDEPITAEEQNLAAEIARREAVLQVYRSFDPIEIDTSDLTPDAVLETVLAVLHRAGLC